jgi:hypothetical protein
LREDLGPTFEKFVERKWQDALNVAAAEPKPWGLEREKTTVSKMAADKAPQGHKGANKTTGVMNVVNQQLPPQDTLTDLGDLKLDLEEVRVQPQTGCDGNHVALQCTRLQKLSLDERRRVLERSGLCMYCLKHAAELECYGQGGPTKPWCMRLECGGGHATGAHKLLGEADASVNLVAGEDFSEFR